MSNQTTKKSIHDGHRERVRENVLKNGFEQLEDHRLLELLLFYSIPRGDTNEIAHRLLNEFGTLSGVIKAPPKKVAKILGVGENSVVLLSAIGELCVRVSKERASKRTAYRTEEEIVELVTSHYLNETEEKFLLVCFDSGMKVRYSGFISEGDSIHTELDMKNFISKVIENDASIIVIAHNHPDGDTSPSGADISTTAAISVMMRKIGVVLYDHVILSQESYLSMRSSKIFKNYFD